MKNVFKGLAGIALSVAFLMYFVITTTSCGQKYTCPTYAGCQPKRQFQPFDDSIGKMASAQKRIIKKAQKENKSSLSFKGHRRGVSLSEWIEDLFAQGHR